MGIDISRFRSDVRDYFAGSRLQPALIELGAYPPTIPWDSS
jgi:hypothetical protein